MLGAALLVALALSSCSSYEQVELKDVTNIAVERMDAQGIAVRVNALVDNPNNYRIHVLDPDVDLYVNDKFIGKGTVAVTWIECKTPSYNAVPDECTIYLDRRLTIGETLKSSVAEIQKLPSVKRAKAKVEVLQYDAVAWTGLKVGQEKYFPTWVLPESHKLVQAGVKAGTVAHGHRPVVDKWVFSTNGVASAGRLGIPTIGFGPANEVYAHTVNEFMPVSDLLKAAVFYAALPQYL